MEFKKSAKPATAPKIGLPLRVAQGSKAIAALPQAALQRDLQQHITRPTRLQRHLAQPALQAAHLHTQEVQRLAVQRQAVQGEAERFPLSSQQVEAALQRQQATPPVIPAQPQGVGDWVTVMRARAEEIQGQRLNPREAAQYTSLQRQVAQTIVNEFRADRQAAAARHQEYASHLATLQQSPGSAPVASVALGLLPTGERPAVQRALDETLQREAEQQAQDAQALQLHSLQRQLAELDHEATQPVFERIQARRGAGNPLPAAIQRHLEQGLNHDLSAVRIHDDAEADKLAKGVNATAFTTGTDIYFQSGKFSPNTQTGLELLAHEVTHTVQQSQGRVGKGIDPDAGLEAQARTTGQRLSQIKPSASSARLRSPVSSVAQTSARLALGSRRLSAAAPVTVAHGLQRQMQQGPAGEPVGKSAFVREEGLNLREQPDQHARSLGTFAFGTKVMVATHKGEWYQVLTPTGKTGYMLASKVYGLDAQHQTMLRQDPGLRLFRVRPGETGMQLVKRAYGITGAEGGRDQNLWHFLNVIRKDNQSGAFGSKNLGRLDAAQNALVPGADANNVLLKANTDLWIPSFTVASKDNSVGSGTVSGEAARLGKNVGQKVKDFQTATAACRQVIGPVFNKRLGEGAKELITGLITSMVAAAGVLVGSTAIGAILGAFAGGVGAAPGAAIGFEVGIWLLEWLGLGFLVAWGASKFLQVHAALDRFVVQVWTANGNQKQLQQAGTALADALAVTAVTALQVLVTIGIAKGLGAATKGLANSRFGEAIGIPRLTAYLEGKIGALKETAASTPKTAKVQTKLGKTSPSMVVEALIKRADAVAQKLSGKKVTVDDLATVSGNAALSTPALRAQFKTMFGARYAKYAQEIEQVKLSHPELRSIPTEDLVAVKGYTSADYTALNGALRSKDPAQLAPLEAYIRCAESGLSQMPKHVGDVFRGTNLPPAVHARYQIGEIVTEDAFTSTSAKIGAEFPGSVKFTVKSLAGRRVEMFSDYPAELEVLFAPATKFRVVSRAINAKTGEVHIEMWEVKP